jgi:hypothetical protein
MLMSHSKEFINSSNSSNASVSKNIFKLETSSENFKQRNVLNFLFGIFKVNSDKLV